MYVVLVWGALSCVIGVIAGSRGRSAIGWTLLSAAISPLASGLILGLSRNLAESNAAADDAKQLVAADQTFITSLANLKTVREKNLFSEDEFRRRKHQLIEGVATSGISTSSPEAFLAALAPFVEDGTLSRDEALSIKATMSMPILNSGASRPDIAILPRAQPSTGPAQRIPSFVWWAVPGSVLIALVVMGVVHYRAAATNASALTSRQGVDDLAQRATWSQMTASPAQPAGGKHRMQWEYYEEGPGEGKYALIGSMNSVDLATPDAVVELSSGPKTGTSVLVRFAREDLLCGVGGCNLNMRFDENAAVVFPVNRRGSASTVVLLGKPDQFIRKIRIAKTLHIEAQFTGGGARSFEFAVRDLRW